MSSMYDVAAYDQIASTTARYQRGPLFQGPDESARNLSQSTATTVTHVIAIGVYAVLLMIDIEGAIGLKHHQPAAFVRFLC